MAWYGWIFFSDGPHQLTTSLFVILESKHLKRKINIGSVLWWSTGQCWRVVWIMMVISFMWRVLILVSCYDFCGIIWFLGRGMICVWHNMEEFSYSAGFVCEDALGNVKIRYDWKAKIAWYNLCGAIWFKWCGIMLWYDSYRVGFACEDPLRSGMIGRPI